MRETMDKQKSEREERLAFSLDEAASLIGVSKNHLRNECKKGKLTTKKSSRRTLILASELRRYLTELPERNTREDR